MLIVLLLFFQWGQPLTYANEQNDVEEKAEEAGRNEVDNKSEVDDHEQIDSNRDLINFNTSEFEIQPNSTGVTITKYLGAGGHVVIPETIEGKPVTIIGDFAFFESQLTEIVIPESVITIGDRAFADNLLSTVVIPDSVTDIGRRSFYINKLTSVTISESITTIGEQAFYGNQLVNVVIPDGVTDIELQAFFGNRITTVTIPDSVTKIGTQAFANNRITNIKIPNSITSIGDEAFSYNQLINVELPNSISSIGNNVFESNKLTTVNIPNSVTSIGKGAFQSNYLTNIELPNSLLSIGNQAFYDNQLKSIVIPNNVTSIGDWVFGQNRLTSVEFPNSLLSIGKMAFYDNQLSNVTFPNSVTSIGDKAFELNRLQWVQFNSPLMLGTDTFINQGGSFDGWYQNLSWETQWNGNVTQPLRIYAKGNVPQYTVTFETNNDSTTIEEQKLLAGEKVVVPDAPVKAGFTFGGWYKDKKFTTPWEFSIDKVSENITLYAKWDIGQQFQLKFETNGGSAVPSQTFTSPMKATKPINPTKTGHLFVDWYKDADCNSLWNFEKDRVTEDTTLYAKWEKVVTQYTLNFETNGGSTVASQKVTKDTLATKPADPTKAGYTFTGWYKDINLTIPWDFSKDVVKSNITLYAHWVTDGSSGGGGNVSPNPEPTIPEKQEPKPEEPIDPQPTETTPQQEPDIIFSDISQGHWGWAMIQGMARQGIITGYQDGTFKPNAPIQRQHAALILTRALALETKKDAREFNDIPKSHLYFGVIDQVQQAGLFEGIDGNFQPTTNMTRAQMAKVLVLAFNLTSSNKDTFKDVPKTHWAHNFIAILAGNGITIGDNGNFRPNDPVTRAEFVAFLYRALHQ